MSEGTPADAHDDALLFSPDTVTYDSGGDVAPAGSQAMDDEQVCDEAVLAVLSQEEQIVLSACAREQRPLTVAQLATTTGLGRHEVGNALDGLKAKGLVSRLNTLVASFACRFPGLQVAAENEEVSGAS